MMIQRTGRREGAEQGIHPGEILMVIIRILQEQEVVVVQGDTMEDQVDLVKEELQEQGEMWQDQVRMVEVDLEQVVECQEDTIVFTGVVEDTE